MRNLSEASNREEIRIRSGIEFESAESVTSLDRLSAAIEAAGLVLVPRSILSSEQVALAFRICCRACESDSAEASSRT